MSESLYLLLIVFYSLIYLKEKKTYGLETLCILLLLIVTPEKLFWDLPNYVEDASRDFDFLMGVSNRTIQNGYMALYMIAYPLCYYIYSYTTKADGLDRLLFFTFTFFTLGLNQLYLCFGISCYLLFSYSNKLWVKLLFLALALLCHLSIFILLIFEVYKYNKKLGVGLFILAIAILYYDPFIYLKFSSIDERIDKLTELKESSGWSVYTIRSQIFSYVCLVIVAIMKKNVQAQIFIVLFMLFSLVIINLHAVFVRRLVELLFIGWIIFFVGRSDAYKINSIPLFFTKLAVIVFLVRSALPFFK